MSHAAGFADAGLDRRMAFYASETRRVLERYLPDEPDPHFGDLVRDYPLRSGKGMRAALCVGAARCYGSSGVDAYPVAAAIELLHAAFLVHDDIEDESHQRRGSPTLHEIVGVPLALNAGDALAILSFQPIFDLFDVVGSRVTTMVLDEFRNAIWRSLEGQALELGWRRSVALDLDVVDYLRMVLRKTCFYSTILPLRAGALIANHPRSTLDALTRFGFYLGAAFQVRDDVLNLTGEEGQYGKEILGDLFEGKRSLPIVHLLTHAGPSDRKDLQAFLAKARGERSVEDVQHVRSLLVRHESVAYASEMADGFGAAAAFEWNQLSVELDRNADAAFLGSLVDFVTRRAV